MTLERWEIGCISNFSTSCEPKVTSGFVTALTEGCALSSCWNCRQPGHAYLECSPMQGEEIQGNDYSNTVSLGVSPKIQLPTFQESPNWDEGAFLLHLAKTLLEEGGCVFKRPDFLQHPGCLSPLGITEQSSSILPHSESTDMNSFFQPWGLISFTYRENSGNPFRLPWIPKWLSESGLKFAPAIGSSIFLCVCFGLVLILQASVYSEPWWRTHCWSSSTVNT